MAEITFFWGITIALIGAVCFYLFYKTQLKWIQTGILIACLLGGTYYLYHYLGRSKMLSTYYDPQSKKVREEQAQLRPVVTHMMRRITKLEFKVLQNRADLKSWWQLGQLYQLKRDLPNAKRAFEQAAKLAPDDLNIKAQYASSCAQNNAGKLDPKTHKMVLSILARAPKHHVALNLLALDAYQTGHLEEAIEYWQTILDVVKQDPKKLQITVMVKKMIQKAQSRLLLESKQG